MKVQNMMSSKGNKIANQFIIEDCCIPCPLGSGMREGTMFQSYDSNIVFVDGKITLLDSHYWDYSVTTGKYRNIFLGETKKETQKKIDSGEYILTNLN